MRPRFTSPAEIAAFNSGVEAVLAIARRSSASIAATSRRRHHEEFAVVALDELGNAGRALLLSQGDGRPQ